MAFQLAGRMKSMMRFKKFLIILTFMPLLCIDNRSSHDWGDDFAQYIHQAANLTRGIPQSETGFIYSQENYIGPRAYPPGFPILLAPVYAVFGNTILAFTVWISLFCFLLAFLVLAFYRKMFSPGVALILAIILIYNPQFLVFKQEIMSDIPFTVFLVLAFLLYPKVKPGEYRSILLFGLVTGFLLLIRSVGFVLLVAMVIDQGLEIYKTRKASRLVQGIKIPLIRQLPFPALLVLIPLMIYFAVNTLILRIPSSGSLTDYLNFYYSGDFLSTIPQNLVQYVEVFRFMYTPTLGDFHFIALISGSVCLTMAVFGFIRKLSRDPELFDFFFIIYLLILLLFPNNYSAFRLLLPVGFILLYYIALGFKMISIPFLIPGSKRVTVVGLFMILLFLPGLVMVFTSRNTVLEGPQQKTAVQAFDYIRKNLPDSAAIVFFKPRALALYTGKQGIVDPITPDPTLIYTQLTKANADYVLVHTDLTGEPMKRYVRTLKTRASLIWKNPKYRLYKINPFNPAEQY